MNFANRVVVSLILVLLIVACVVLAVAPGQFADVIRAALFALDGQQDVVSRVSVAVGALVVTALSFVILIAEWRRPKRSSVVLAKSAGGTAELAIESISMRLKRAAESIPGIRNAEALVRGGRGGISVLMRLSSDPEGDLPEISKQVMDAVREESETRIGIPVKSLRITFKHAPAGGRSILPAAFTGRQGKTGTE